VNNVYEGFAIIGIYLAPLMAALAIGGIFSDFILPRCPRLLCFLEWVFGIDLGP